MTCSPGQRLSDAHVAILARHQAVKRAIHHGRRWAAVIDICEDAFFRLGDHLVEEEEIMAGLGMPEALQKRHRDHHRMIIAFFEGELRRLKTGESDGRAAMEMADEWIRTHAERFDNQLTRYLMDPGQGIRAERGSGHA